MIAVDRIHLREIGLPLREPFQISSGTVTHRRILLLELEERSGLVTWAECVAMEQPNYSPETIDTAWMAITRWVAPRVLGRSFAAAAEVAPALEVGFRGHPMAKAAVEMGVWALEAELLGTSLSRHLGGRRTTVPTGISIGIQESPEALVRKAAEALDAGYQKIKVKIQPGADVSYVAAVREALGRDASLMADANSAYTLNDAEHLAHLDEFGLIMIEQPLGVSDLVRHAELQKRIRTPICLDESITGLDQAQDMITLGSGRIVNIKPGRVGGFHNARAIHDLCQDHDIPVWCGGMLESGVGRAYNVALASLPNFTLPGDLSPSARYWERDVVTPEWTMNDAGEVEVPHERPGLGIHVDEGRIDELTVRRQTLLPSASHERRDVG